MAKSLRSKSKRKNRAALREKLVIPKIKKTTEELAKKLQESLKQKGGSSILALKAVLRPKETMETSQSSEQTVDTLEQGVNEEAEDEAEEDEAEEVNDEQSAKRAKPAAQIRRKGSKPRANVGKELVWFK